MSHLGRSVMGKVLLLLSLLLSLLLVTACSTSDVSLYAKNTPKFELQSFFSGSLTAHGILKNRSGEVIRYFNATLEGSWDDGVGTLAEVFVFDDGEVQKRTWTMTPNEQGNYTATANDVIGSGEVKIAGNALFMNYVLQVPYDGDLIEVNVDDRMYMVKEGVVINESVMRKFGVEVGYLSIVIEQADRQL
ncbi:DUF3833 domain-containing protein [Marinomonas sp. M1K-6]|uniref:DUF3833 domain-containing protein n=1 Tax=Marinomonas profundi TaxID=2726122 RepID=A0A847R8S0_9GAMM|nr:DUF3833 domain-containing protein [Marinomonas profundi]NLQ18863.1 DUF3833 domain-containing protein [Marinomonas profundi]UDV01790.1 DUF3833 domain-containing protein [Marinomonas profundi]